MSRRVRHNTIPHLSELLLFRIPKNGRHLRQAHRVAAWSSGVPRDRRRSAALGQAKSLPSTGAGQSRNTLTGPMSRWRSRRMRVPSKCSKTGRTLPQFRPPAKPETSQNRGISIPVRHPLSGMQLELKIDGKTLGPQSFESGDIFGRGLAPVHCFRFSNSR